MILSGAVLLTDANVALPAVLLGDRRQVLKVLRFWALAWLGDLVGALLIGMAALFATMGRTIIGKYVPVMLAACSQHTSLSCRPAVRCDVRSDEHGRSGTEPGACMRSVAAS